MITKFFLEGTPPVDVELKKYTVITGDINAQPLKISDLIMSSRSVMTTNYWMVELDTGEKIDRDTPIVQRMEVKGLDDVFIRREFPYQHATNVYNQTIAAIQKDKGQLIMTTFELSIWNACRYCVRAGIIKPEQFRGILINSNGVVTVDLDGKGKPIKPTPPGFFDGYKLQQEELDDE